MWLVDDTGRSDPFTPGSVEHHARMHASPAGKIWCRKVADVLDGRGFGGLPSIAETMATWGYAAWEAEELLAGLRALQKGAKHR